VIPSVALIGASGHGRSHREKIGELQAAGRVRLAGLADIRPEAGVYPDHRDLLSETRPDVVIICTPPRTHLPIALDALAAGCDLLLEKPPVLNLGEHETLATAVRKSGRLCQVGFQALGSVAATRLHEAVAGFGAVRSIAAVGSWQRDDAYYARAPWAGRRNGDGVLANPLAHALMQSLAVAAAAGAGPPTRLEVERYRTRPIEVDDTAFARITFGNGLRVLAAVTLAGEPFIPGEIIVDGGRAVLEYPTDRLALPGDRGMTAVPGRTDLLENLLDHRADPKVPLVVPLERTRPFTAILEKLTAASLPPPTLLEPPLVLMGEVRLIDGINAVLRRAAEKMALPSELGVPWAVPPHTAEI
jgi:predicted dehydrogenase